MKKAENKNKTAKICSNIHSFEVYEVPDLAAVDMVSEEVGSTGPPRQYKVPKMCTKNV